MFGVLGGIGLISLGPAISGEDVLSIPPSYIDDEPLWWNRHRLVGETTNEYFGCVACGKRFSRLSLVDEAGAPPIPRCKVRPRDLVPEPATQGPQSAAMLERARRSPSFFI